MTARRIEHPGPPTLHRHSVERCKLHPVSLRLEAGVPLAQAIAEAFSSAGFDAGWITLEDVPLARLAYVIPALSADATHAAWYSPVRQPDEGGRILRAGLHHGLRDGEPFQHCHGIWDIGADEPAMGHLLLPDCELAASVMVEAVGLSGARLSVTDDAETNFRLFKPERTKSARSDGSEGLLVTLRPNIDVCSGLAQIAAEHGFDRCEIVGIGSLVGVEYVDPPPVVSPATEILIERGLLTDETVSVAVATVDADGTMTRGQLEPGQNSVCVTFEIILRKA